LIENRIRNPTELTLFPTKSGQAGYASQTCQRTKLSDKSEQALTTSKQLIIRLKAFNIITWGHRPKPERPVSYQPEGLKQKNSLLILFNPFRVVMGVDALIPGTLSPAVLLEAFSLDKLQRNCLVWAICN
jgi:hypothetical protein